MPDDPTQFRLLGNIEAVRAGHRVDIGPARQRCVLAILLVEANTVIGTDELIERVWPGQRRPNGRDNLQGYLTRLRRALPEIAITRQAQGYRLTVDEATVDLHRFRALLRAAEHGSDQDRLDRLDEALSLWQGHPFAGQDVPWLNAVGDALDTEHARADLDRVDLQLRLGRHAEILPGLITRATDRPLDERLAGQVMLALHRSGRQADALHHYDRTRAHLTEELAATPGPDLRELHQRMLTADPTLTIPPAPEPSKAPRQLPAAPRSFTGRAHELDRITTLMNARVDPPSTVIISAIGGTGGIGKTWLALHWAHHNLHRFPDGQLFVNLRGFDPSGTPTTPEDAVLGFLDALGVAPSAVPADLDAQTALYRSLVADQRLLIVLDNAANPAQVVPLLPGSPTCTVLVTSRDRLVSLINAHGAQPLPLDALSDAEARALLATRLGQHRLAHEPDAVTSIISSCAGLPLALSIVAGRALEHPDFPLADIAEELHDSANRLTTLDEDPETSIRSVLSWSRAGLTPRQARIFALVGRAPGPDIGLAAAANLAGLDDQQTRADLAALERVSLIQQHAPGRYRMHDLVRLYAGEQPLPAPDRDAALLRLIAFYAYSAYLIEQKMEYQHAPLDVPPPPPGCRPTDRANRAEASEWFAIELPNLLAALTLANRTGCYALAWQLTWSTNTYTLREGGSRIGVVIWEAALEAARRLGDIPQEIRALRTLGHQHSRLGRYPLALDYSYQALALAEQHADPDSRPLLIELAHSHNALTFVFQLAGDNEKALEHALKALELDRILDDPNWLALALNAAGWISATLGRLDEAKSYCEEALATQLELGDRDSMAGTLDSLGYIEHQLGNHAAAIDHYQRALSDFRDFNDLFNQADTLLRLGEAHADLGAPDEARTCWREALQLYTDQGRDEDAETVRERLVELAREDGHVA